MTIGKVFLTAAVLALSIPATPTFASPTTTMSGMLAITRGTVSFIMGPAGPVNGRTRKEGFYSRSEHRAYH